MKKLAVIICGLYLALSFIFYSSSVIAAEKYGIVDLQKILVQCNAGKKNVEILKKMGSDKFKPLKKKDAELRKLKDALEKQKSVLSKAMYTEKEMALQKQARDLQIRAKDAADEMKVKEEELLNKLIPEIDKAIKAIGEREKYTMITDARAPAYFSKDIDLTQKVIEELNKTYKPRK
jgi:outer membrane protein